MKQIRVLGVRKVCLNYSRKQHGRFLKCLCRENMKTTIKGIVEVSFFFFLMKLGEL